MTTMNRRDFSRSVGTAVGWSTLSGPAIAGSTSKRPNILFIYADQHSGRVMGCSGHRQVHTPHLDGLAGRGVLFRNAYCASPLCVPGRAGMASGRVPSDVGSFCNSTVFDGRVPTWFEHLSESGYRGFATGKLDFKGGLDYGFEERETTHKHGTNPDITSLFRRPLCYRVDERPLVEGSFEDRVHVDHRRVEILLDFLRREAGKLDQPWFFHVGLDLPHHPFVAHSRYREMYRPERIVLPNLPEGHLENIHPVLRAQRNFKLLSTPVPEQRIRRARAGYYAMITELDDYLGVILRELQEGGWLENTIVVYTADHGEMHGNHGLWLKNNLLEDSARIPLILSGPGIPAGREIDTPVSHLDLVATLLELGGLPVPGELPGRSLLAGMSGPSETLPPYVYAESHSEGNLTGSFLIRRGDFKYVYFSWFPSLLFNVHRDPQELNNLSGRPEHAAVEKELHSILVSRLDPDEVTERAFREQERFLQRIVESQDARGFYNQIRGRLGDGQAGVLTNQHFPGFRVPS